MKNELGSFLTGVREKQQVEIDQKNGLHEFVEAYLSHIESVRQKNDQHPLVYYIVSINRISPQSVPLVGTNKRYAVTRNATKHSGLYDYMDSVREVIEKPLNYADDYRIQPHYWRRSKREEKLRRSIDNMRYRYRGVEKNLQLAQSLASLYFQSALVLYSQKSTFMEMAAADVFHSRAEWYANIAFSFTWEKWEKEHNVRVDSRDYSNNRFEPSPELQAFYYSKKAAMDWLNVPASEAWKRLEQRSLLSRDRRIANLVAIDRLEEKDIFDNLEEYYVVTMEQARSVLFQGGVII